MRTWFLFLGLLVAAATAQDSLPWQGAIVFDDPVRVDDAPGLSGHPAIHPQTIMDSTWTLYSVWADDRDNNGRFEVYFAASYDTARSWTANVNLSRDPSQYYVFPWLAADGNNLYVMWQAWRGNTWRILFTRSSDRGINWTDPAEPPGITVVNDFNSGINFGPQPKLAVDGRSNPDTTFLYLLWADNATGKIQMKLGRSVDLGASFADLGIVDKNPDNVNRHPHIAVDHEGRVHCAWALGTGGTNQDPHPWIGYNRSLDRGATFLPADIVVNDNTNGVYRGNPSITCNPGTGEVLISWEDSRRASGNSNPDIWFARIPRDSLSASANERVNWWAPDTGAKYDNYKPVIRMDPQGVMVAAWHDNPENSSSYGIHMAAYSDSARRFSASQSLIRTFTGTSSGSFGSNFYPPSLFVQAMVDTSGDTTTHFYLVWQDFGEDSVGGNIYSVHGRVVKILGDLDVDNDSLGVHNDTLELSPNPPGTPYEPYARGVFLLANTWPEYNPDTVDGPSRSWIRSIRCSGSLVDTLHTPPRGRLDSIVVAMPDSLDAGQAVACTLSVYVPAGTPDGDYVGVMLVEGEDTMGVTIQETFKALVRILGDLDVDNDSLRVHADTIDLWTQPAGPVYSPWAKAAFVLANTSTAYNPDDWDGPSRSWLDYLTYSGKVSTTDAEFDSIFVLHLPESLMQGEVVVCTLALVVPVGTPLGQFTGNVLIEARDISGFVIQERFGLRINGPRPRQSLDSLGVAPIPFKPNHGIGHDAIHFQGLTKGARVIVYDASGQEVWRDTEKGDGHIAWKAEVASGIYVYLVVAEDGTSRVGKLSVIR